MFSKLESFKGMILLGDLFASFSSLPVDIARAECCEDTPQKKIKETKNSQFMILRGSGVVEVGENPWCVVCAQVVSKVPLYGLFLLLAT